MTMHTVDPTATTLDRAVRTYLNAIGDRPVRYETADGTIINTPACQGRNAWYVAVEARHDNTVTIAAVRIYRGGRLRVRELVRDPATIAGPGFPSATSILSFTVLLAATVGMALGDVERAQAEACR